MKRFRRLSAIWASFYSAALYRDVATRWKGIGLLYLMLLLALCWLPSAVRWFVGLREFSAAGVPVIVKQLPTVTIANGVMSASPPGRHLIRIPGATNEPGELILIVDDTIDGIPADAPGEVGVLTRREFGTIRPKRNERRVWTLTPAADMVVTPDDVSAFLRSLQFWVPAIGYAGAIAGSLVFRMVQAMLYAAGVLVYSRRRGADFTHATAIRLAAVAVTPVIVLRTLLWLVGWEPVWYLRWPTAVLITVLYLGCAVRAVASAETTTVPTRAQ